MTVAKGLSGGPGWRGSSRGKAQEERLGYLRGGFGQVIDAWEAHLRDKGVEIVSAVRSLDPLILRCIRHHHEWFDGSGYPTGVAGEEIPLGARIITISDSVDAMLSDRPYRKALSIDEVRREVLRNSGTQFDPVVIEAALTAGILDTPVVTEEVVTA